MQHEPGSSGPPGRAAHRYTPAALNLPERAGRADAQSPEDDVYTTWERHKLAVLGVRRGSIAGMVGLPAAFAADLVLRRAGLAHDTYGDAVLRISVAVGGCALCYLYVRLRGMEVRHPFAIATFLVLVVTLIAGLAAAPTGGFASPHFFGLGPLLLGWVLLMPGGARYAVAPLAGGFATLVASVYLATPGPVALPQAVANATIQAISVGMALGCSEVLERWRRRHATEATTDWLTGAMTRRCLLERVEALCAHRTRSPAPIAVAMFDLDRFKEVNDTHGHATGDEVLRGVALAVRGEIRRDDLFGRYGGDEFALVMDECDRQQAWAAVERLRARVAATSFLGRNVRVSVTVSAGIVLAAPGEPLNAPVLLQAADEALYASKQAGRDRSSLVPRAATG